MSSGHEHFLSVKRDLALVRFPYIHYFFNSLITVLFISPLLIISTSTIHTQATQAIYVAEEWVNQAFCVLKEEESKCSATQNSLTLTNKKLKKNLLKLEECDKARKSVEASIESSER